MTSLMQLIYVSRATQPFKKPDLDALAARSDENNKSAGVTGLLLFNQGHFMQLLEGHESIVYGLYQRIREDDRHTDVELLVFERTRERIFNGWNMGVIDLGYAGPIDKKRYATLIDLLTRYDEVFDARQRAKVLFAEFKQAHGQDSKAA